MGALSIWHWVIVLAVVVILFGSGKLVKLAGDMGRALPEFRKAAREAKEVEEEVKTTKKELGL